MLSFSVLSLSVERLWKFILEDESSWNMNFISQLSPSLSVFQNCTKINVYKRTHQALENICNPRTSLLFNSAWLQKWSHEVSGTACWAKNSEAWIKMEISGPYLSCNVWESFSSKINICHQDYIVHKEAVGKKLHRLMVCSKDQVTKLCQFPNLTAFAGA